MRPSFSSRINLHDLRAEFVKLLGPKKDAQYIKILTQFLGNKISKSVLDRQVLLIIGRENVALHNQFIRAIYVNAACGVAPTPITIFHTTSKPVKGIRRKPVASKGTTIEPLFQSKFSPVYEDKVNNDVLTSSPKKLQSVVLDHDASKEREILAASKTAVSLEVQVDAGKLKTWGNGSIDALLCRASHQPEATEQPDFSNISSPLPYATNGNVRTCNELDSGISFNTSGTGNVEVELRGDPKDAELEEAIASAKSPIEAPLGVPFCAGSTGACRRTPIPKRFRALQHTLLGHSIDEESFEVGYLPDDGTMQRRLEQVAVGEGGLQTVGSNCANLLNTAVDIHLKRLISACIDLAKARHTSHSDKPQHFGKHKIDQFTLTPPVSRPYLPISLLDFNLAMDLNPGQLGGNWPTLLEKIALQRFDQTNIQINQKHLL